MLYCAVLCLLYSTLLYSTLLYFTLLYAAKTTALSALPSLKQALPIVAGVVPASLLPSMALATEGTNEWLGVDDLRLLAVLFFGHWAILSLYLNWSKGFDEEEVRTMGGEGVGKTE